MRGRRLLAWVFGVHVWLVPPQALAAQGPALRAGVRPLAVSASLAHTLPPQPLVRDTMPAREGWPPGVAGALIGAVVGVAAGAVLVRGLCDVPDCGSHPDTRKLLLGGAVTGAAAGIVIELVWRGARRLHDARAPDRDPPGQPAALRRP